MRLPDYSFNSFSKFLNTLDTLNGINDHTQKNLKRVEKFITAADPTTVDVRKLDAEEVLRKHISMIGSNVSDTSFNSYKSFFQQAVKLFTQYVDDDDEMKINNSYQAGRVKANPNEVIDNTATQTTTVSVFELPIPLRKDLIVVLTDLPRDLSKEEARRISRIIESYAIGEEGFH
ncbi:hypothetical protein ACKS2O_001937 [Cronobacter dublinensis]